ncbi:MAG: NAD(P)-dependent dehydrogenase (short-subunit alcohol dehydrogenase family) [Paraglaciecola psychrophila]|jgi:NAD(P)-dependent dehydrogenase (short-subunit alcohol dehydrogenase family)
MDTSPKHIIVIGGNGGIGQAMVDELLHYFPAAIIHSTHCRNDVARQHERINWHQLDIRDTEQIEAWSSTFTQVDWIINCAGYLHGDMGGPEKSISAVEADFLIENIKVNTLPTLALAKHFKRALRKSAAPILATVSARVGSISDNKLGGWYSYRISKAALNMALKTLSIEWQHSHPRGCVAALHPGTNDTHLSQPFQANVPPERLFKPSYTASKFVALLAQLEPKQTGNFWAWDGTKIPW